MTEIALEWPGNPRNIIWSGLIAVGYVRIETKKKITMRGIRLEVRGYGRVRWSETTGPRTRHFVGQEQYLRREIEVTGSRNNSSELCIEPGSQKFIFFLGVPSRSPQSFESDTGDVRYTAKVIIDRPKKKNITKEIKLTVGRLLDLNEEPWHLRGPITVYNPGLEFHRSAGGTFCCDCSYWCCNWRCCICCISGTVETTMTVNRGCFVSGETIRVEGEFRNVSSDEVKRTSIIFVQRITYGHYGRPNGHSTLRERVLATVGRPGLSKGESDKFQNVEFLVPDHLPPSRLDGCSFIHIAYFVEMRVHYTVLTTCNGRCEVIIGNLPLRNASQQPSVMTFQSAGLPSITVIGKPAPSSIGTPHSAVSTTVTSQPEPSSTETHQPPPYSTVTSQPEPYSTVTSQPEPSSIVISHPEPSSIMTSQPELSSIVTSQPEPSSIKRSQPELSSIVTSQPEPSSTVSYQPEPSLLLQPSPTDEFLLTPAPVLHP